MKEFKKKYMHPTRRKLADMIKTGEYDKNTVVSTRNRVANDVSNIPRGESITDADGNVWSNTEFGIIKEKKSTNVFSKLRNELANKRKCNGVECKTVKYSSADVELIKKTKYCATCLAMNETKVQLDGLWSEYSEYRMCGYMLADAERIRESLNVALKDVDADVEYVNDDGSTESWKSYIDLPALKKSITDDIEKVDATIADLTAKKARLYDILKDKNYDFI